MSALHEHGGPTCRELFARLSEYLDGEIDAEACAHVEGHLHDCPPCQAFLESLRRTVRWIHEMPEAAAGDEVKRAVLAAWSRLRHDARRS